MQTLNVIYKSYIVSRSCSLKYLHTVSLKLTNWPLRQLTSASGSELLKHIRSFNVLSSLYCLHVGAVVCTGHKSNV